MEKKYSTFPKKSRRKVYKLVQKYNNKQKYLNFVLIFSVVVFLPEISPRPENTNLLQKTSHAKYRSGIITLLNAKKRN